MGYKHMTMAVYVCTDFHICQRATHRIFKTMEAVALCRNSLDV
ncbi:MAG: hypothetical protein SOY99_04070 [Alloprevotella sp.]|nr:hypothetical protein [Alloprevotella sp.]